jgi:hypothetical protein
MAAFYLDFEVGGFNPSTLGVCVRLPSSLSEPVRLAVAAGLLSEQTETGRKEVFKGAYRRDLDDDTKFALLSYFAVIEHELRHFHEYLATPYGQTMMFAHLQLASFVPAILNELANEESVVLPLSSWAALSDDLYQTILSQPGYAKLKRRPPPITSCAIPHCDRIMKELQSLAQPRHGILDEYKEWTVTIKQLMEATAVNTQLRALANIFNDKNIIGPFLEQLRLKDKARIYTHVFNLWYTIECQIDKSRAGRLMKPMIGYGIRNAVMFFCLCATERKEITASNQDDNIWPGNTAHPGDVFSMLFGHMVLSKEVPAFKDIMTWLDQRASELGLLTLKESLENSVRLSRSRAYFLRSIGARIEHGEVMALGPALLDAYDDWIDGQEYMCNQIIEDPLTFFEPERYLRSFGKWVGAPGFILTDVSFEEGETLKDAFEADQRKRHKRWRFAALSEAPIFGIDVVSLPSMWTLAVAAHTGIALFKVNKTDSAYQDLSRAMLRVQGGHWKVWEA